MISCRTSQRSADLRVPLSQCTCPPGRPGRRPLRQLFITQLTVALRILQISVYTRSTWFPNLLYTDMHVRCQSTYHYDETFIFPCLTPSPASSASLVRTISYIPSVKIALTLIYGQMQQIIQTMKLLTHVQAVLELYAYGPRILPNTRLFNRTAFRQTCTLTQYPHNPSLLTHADMPQLAAWIRRSAAAMQRSSLAVSRPP